MVIEDVLSVYYFTDDNLTSKAGIQVINEMYRITKKYGPYRGYLADVYRFLFRLFDMHGFYDQPLDQQNPMRRFLFRGTLAIYMLFLAAKP